MKPFLLFLFVVSLFACQPKEKAAFEEKDGFVLVEAEDYTAQEKDELRQWYMITEEDSLFEMEGFKICHAATASNKAYVKLLPDTRVTHADKLIPGENFSDEPGQVAILSYDVKFNTPGKYYVWVRAFSTGSEDNGIHVGLDGEWPASGQRMQWCEGKHQWTWESKQRTDKIHCGEPELIYLEIAEAGVHTITFSMREDGFEFDCFALSQKYEVPKME